MGTSLIGKALNFGFNDYGFESHVPNLLHNHAHSYTLSTIGMHSAKHKMSFKMRYTRKSFTFLRFFRKINLISNYFVVHHKQKWPYVQVSVTYFKNVALYNNCRIFSRPSKQFFISHYALTILAKRIGVSVYIISTDIGLLTHYEAIAAHKGGVLIAYLSV